MIQEFRKKIVFIDITLRKNMLRNVKIKVTNFKIKYVKVNKH